MDFPENCPSREAAYLLHYFFPDFLGKTWTTSLRRRASVPGLDLGTRPLHCLVAFHNHYPLCYLPFSIFIFIIIRNPWKTLFVRFIWFLLYGRLSVLLKSILLKHRHKDPPPPMSLNFSTSPAVKLVLFSLLILLCCGVLYTYIHSLSFLHIHDCRLSRISWKTMADKVKITIGSVLTDLCSLKI